MKPRYIKQRDKSSCGPIAVINALKWSGHRVTELNSKKEIKIISRCAKFNPHNPKGLIGVPPDKLDQVMREFTNLNVGKRISTVKLKQIDQALDNGNAVILRYFWERGNRSGGHYILCVNKSDKTYTVVNDGRKVKTVMKRNRKTMERMLTTKLDGEGPVAWIISK